MTAAEESSKAACRRRVRGVLADIDPASRHAAAAALRDRLLERLTELQARTVMTYLADEAELDLDPTIEAMLSRNLVVAVPAVLPERGLMAAARIHSLAPNSLDRDRYGLRQPRPPHEWIEPTALDAVIVPGVAFTTDGHRLGRGGGYYDRWLASLPGSIRRIGVGFAAQVVPDLPIEPHDATVDELVAI